MKIDIQKEAINSIDENVFVSAGAGTGKTYILVHRFLELLSQNKALVPEILAITFTEKAAKEMKDRIRAECALRAKKDPIWLKHKRDLENSRIGTIHGFCARMIKENPVEFGIDPKSEILDEIEGYALLEKYIHGQLLNFIDENEKDTLFLISEYSFKYVKNILNTLISDRINVDIIVDKFISLNDIEILKSYNTEISALDKKMLIVSKAIINIYGMLSSGYESFKKDKGLLDFNDLIIYTKQLLKNNKSLRRFYQNIIRYILVDEFQDTDYHQKEIIFYLAENNTTSCADKASDLVLSENRLFIVGDSKQSIYRFRGADVSVFEDTRRVFEKAGKCLKLNINRRTTPQNIDFFNKLFGDIMGRGRQGKEYYEADYTDIIPFRTSDTKAPAIEFLSVPYHENNTAGKIRSLEAELIARKIICLTKDNYHFRDISILFRAMPDIKIYEDALRKYNIPYYLISGSGFYARQEILDILNYLKIIDNSKDMIAFAGVLRSPMAGLSDNDLFYMNSKEIAPSFFTKDLSYLRDIKNKISISALIQEIVSRTNFRAILSPQYMGEQLISNINKIIECARRFESKGIFTLTDFINYLDELVLREAREGEAAISEEESDVVRIMTIHKAKGLEFPVVIIPDVSRKTKPISGPVLYDKKYIGLGIKVKDEDGELQETAIRGLIKEELQKKDMAESKRLLYVASTRVKDYLIYSGNFENSKNTWADWLIKHCDTFNIKATKDLPVPVEFTMPHSSPTAIDKGIDVSSILRQVEPIPNSPKVFFTATKLYAKEKQSKAVSAGAGANVGIAIHTFLKHWDFNIDTLPKDNNIKKYISSLINNPIFSEIKSALVIHKELPLTFKHNGVIIEGVIDLFFKNPDGSWTILDYKTDNVTEGSIKERADSYAIQLKTYALGISRIMGIKAKKIILFFMTPGIAYELKYNEQDFEAELTDLIIKS